MPCNNKGKKKKSRLKGSQRAQEGGLITGKSHEEGGEVIEVEGEEVVVNNSINNAASIHKDGLLALNENPEGYTIQPVAKSGGLVKNDSANRSMIDMLEFINEHGNLPMFNAKDRRKK